MAYAYSALQNDDQASLLYPDGNHSAMDHAMPMTNSDLYDWEKYEKLLDQMRPTTYKPSIMALGSKIGKCWTGVDLSARSNCCLTPSWLTWKAVESSKPMAGKAIFSKISEGVPMFEELLKGSVNPNCPDDFLGVWWQRDGSGAETLITWHEADWKSKKEAAKQEIYGWTFTPSWMGYLVSAGRFSNTLPVDISPSGKWVRLGGNQFIYTVQPGDSFTDPDTGAKVEYIKAGDKMRVQLNDCLDPSKGWGWQYLVQQIAYKDATGKVVLTEHYDELKRRATYETASICYNNFVCCPTEDQEIQLYSSIRDEQFFYVRPDPDTEAAPADAEMDAKLEAAFKEIDTNGSGAIEASELKVVLEKMGVKLSDEAVAKVFTAADVNGDKKLDLAEYKALVGKAMKK